MLKEESGQIKLLSHIRHRLKEEMESRGVKPGKLAERIEESPSWLSQQLNRNKTFGIFDLLKITDGLEITIDEILPEEKRNNPGIDFEEHLRFIIREELKTKK